MCTKMNRVSALCSHACKTAHKSLPQCLVPCGISQILKIPLITNLMLNMSLMKKELRFHEFPSPPMTQIMLVVFSVGTLLLFSYNGT